MPFYWLGKMIKCDFTDICAVKASHTVHIFIHRDDVYIVNPGPTIFLHAIIWINIVQYGWIWFPFNKPIIEYYSLVSRQGLFRTKNFEGWPDWDQPRRRKSCWDQDFYKGSDNHPLGRAEIYVHICIKTGNLSEKFMLKSLREI